MTKTLAIVTGATRGIGKSLTERLASNEITVLAIGRDDGKLRDFTKSQHSGFIIPFKGDICKTKDLDCVIEKMSQLAETHQLKYLIHNATILDPIKPLTEVTGEEILHQMKVNVIGPTQLTNGLLTYFCEGSRILFMSTGASRAAITNLVPHCAAKAAQVILAKGYQDSLKQRNILVALVEPGVVDTPSQEYVRTLSVATLPFSDTARRIHSEGGLTSPDRCAAQLFSLMCCPPGVFNSNWPWKLKEEEYLANVGETS